MQPGNPNHGYYGPPQIPGQPAPRPGMPPYGYPPPPGMPPMAYGAPTFHSTAPPMMHGPPPPVAAPPVAYGAPPQPYGTHAYISAPGQPQFVMSYGPPPVVAVATPANMPLTIFVGKIPESFDNEFTQRVLGLFGNVTKWNSTPGKKFGFATFAHGIAAFRCFTVLHGFEVNGQPMECKAGVKETATLDELRTEQQTTNAEAFADELKELRSKLQTLIMQRDMGMDNDASILAESNTTPSQNGSNGAPSGLTQEEDETERKLKEAVLEFRSTQAVHEKGVEASRRARLEAKKREISEKSEEKSQGRTANSDQSKSSERGRSGSSRNDRGRDRSRSRDQGLRRGYEGSEADRRRRREVLAQMASSLDQEQEEGSVHPDATMGPVKLDLRLQAKQQAKTKSFQSREFAEDGEEQASKKSRTIIPIDYTEEEKMAALSIQDQLAATAARINASLTEPSDRMKEIAERIPKNPKDLFNFSIDWALLNQHAVLQTHIEPWVVKKMNKYLGGDAAEFIEFVCKLLHNATTPQEITNEVQDVLDNDTDPFVLSLWKLLVFHQLKLQDSR